MLAEKIQQLRKKQGMSQEELANKLNVSRQSISKWELNEAQPEISKLKSLSEIFNVSIDYLLNDEITNEKKESNESNKVIDSSFKSIVKIGKRYGWMAGIYYAGLGFLIFIMGYISNQAFNNMFNYSLFGDTPFSNGNPVSKIMMIFGVIFIVGGLIFAIFIKNKYKSKD